MSPRYWHTAVTGPVHNRGIFGDFKAAEGFVITRLFRVPQGLGASGNIEAFPLPRTVPMALRPHFAREPLVLLREARPLKALFNQTLRLAHLQRLVDGQLQPAARAHCQVASWREGTLLLVVTDAHWATRLRYQQRRLQRDLQALQEFHGLLRILFKVEPLRGGAPRQRAGAMISSDAAEALQATAEGISDPALRAALERLAARGSTPER